jgi:hypothetical protein
MSRRARRSSAPSSTEGAGEALSQGEEAVKNTRRLRIGEAKKRKEPADLFEDDIYFIVEMTYQRQLMQWSQEEVAEKAGVRRTTIQLLESFQRGLSLQEGVRGRFMTNGVVLSRIDS